MTDPRIAGSPLPHGHGAGIPWGRMVSWAVLIFFLLLTLFPLWWVVRTGLSTSGKLFGNPTSLLPTAVTLVNFERVLGMLSQAQAISAGGSGQTFNFLIALRNSVIFTALVVVGQVFSSALGAYAFARLRFRFRESIFFLYVTGLMIPPVVTLIPNFVLVHDLGWLNTFPGLVAPFFLMSPFSVFFLRQFMLSVPGEFQEAAILDGAGHLRIFLQIVLPFSQTALVTLGIVVFFTSWTSFLWPYLVGTDESIRVLTAALVIFQNQNPMGSPDWTGLMAGTALSMVPSIVILAVAGRKVVESLQFSGLK